MGTPPPKPGEDSYLITSIHEISEGEWKSYKKVEVDISEKIQGTGDSTISLVSTRANQSLIIHNLHTEGVSVGIEGFQDVSIETATTEPKSPSNVAPSLLIQKSQKVSFVRNCCLSLGKKGGPIDNRRGIEIHDCQSVHVDSPTIWSISSLYLRNVECINIEGIVDHWIASPINIEGHEPLGFEIGSVDLNFRPGKKQCIPYVQITNISKIRKLSATGMVDIGCASYSGDKEERVTKIDECNLDPRGRMMLGGGVSLPQAKIEVEDFSILHHNPAVIDLVNIRCKKKFIHRSTSLNEVDMVKERKELFSTLTYSNVDFSLLRDFQFDIILSEQTHWRKTTFPLYSQLDKTKSDIDIDAARRLKKIAKESDDLRNLSVFNEYLLQLYRKEMDEKSWLTHFNDRLILLFGSFTDFGNSWAKGLVCYLFFGVVSYVGALLILPSSGIPAPYSVMIPLGSLLIIISVILMHRWLKPHFLQATLVAISLTIFSTIPSLEVFSYSDLLSYLAPYDILGGLPSFLREGSPFWPYGVAATIYIFWRILSLVLIYLIIKAMRKYQLS